MAAFDGKLDVLPADRSQKVASAIKYPTPSTWPHAAIYLGALTGAVFSTATASTRRAYTWSLIVKRVRHGARQAGPRHAIREDRPRAGGP